MKKTTPNTPQRRTHIGFAIIACALVFLLSTGATAYGAWQVVDAAENKISTTNLDAKLTEGPAPSGKVYPGADITQHLYITNTGEEELFARVKVSTQFVKRDSGGTIVETLPDTNNWIEVTYNTIDWKDGSDGYHYLRGVLPTAATSPSLIGSMKLSTAATEAVAGYDAHLLTSMEVIQTTANAVGVVWNKTYEFMEATEPPPNPTVYSKITFIDPATGFVFDPANKNLFPNAGSLTPGETAVSMITFTNDYTVSTDITISAGSFVQDDDSRLLSQYAILTITDETGAVVFNGPAAGDAWQAFAHSITLAPGASDVWTIVLTLDPNAGNDIQNITTANLYWQVTANEHIPTPGPDPDPDPDPDPNGGKGGRGTSGAGGSTAKTGDTTWVVTWGMLALASGITLIVLIRKRQRLNGEVSHEPFE